MAHKPVHQSLIQTETTFNSFGLDQRILKAISKLNWKNPTLIQSTAIPLALKGKDILGRARTGSGKTGAYAIPIIQKILIAKQRGDKNQKSIKALVLVPTKELTEQVKNNFTELFTYCSREVSVYQLANDQIPAIQKPRLEELPDIIVATPGRLYLHLTSGNLVLNSVETLVIDEADLMLSYGFEKDLKSILRLIPTSCQTFLMSATLSSDVESLKNLYLHNPAILKLEEPEKSHQLSQFFVQCASLTEKYLTLYCLLKFQVIVGKVIVFTNDILTCYQVKIFLERFALKSAVLNSELPQNSRLHVIKEFNRGQFDILIATDESLVSAEDRQDDPSKKEKQQKKGKGKVETNTQEEDQLEEMDESEGKNENEEEEENAIEEEGNEEEKEEEEENAIEEERNEDEEENGDEEGNAEENDEEKENEEVEEEGNEKEEEEGNEEEKEEVEEEEEEEAELPKVQLPSLKLNRRKKKKRSMGDSEYGIARGLDFKNVAAVINFDIPLTFQNYIHRIGRTARATAKGTALSFVLPNFKKTARHYENKLKESGATVKPLEVNKDNLDRFRYRVEDVLRGISTKQVNDARLAEIKNEILNSEKLKTHFEENPNDYNALTHTQNLLSTKSYKHLQIVPDYLMPQGKPQSITEDPRLKKMGGGRGGRGGRAGRGRNYRDPLKNMSLRNYTKMGKPVVKRPHKKDGQQKQQKKKKKDSSKTNSKKSAKSKHARSNRHPNKRYKRPSKIVHDD